MSEYWVSKKKYYCKYCEIYIADDAPSRQQHENGLRHKGNKERFVRGLYKSSEKKKHDLEEEQREMARVERAAQAAFAQDVGSGLAKAGPSSVKLPPPKAASVATPSGPTNKWANYSTAESLGFKDPDAERLQAEAERHRTQGVVGNWEVVDTSQTAPPEASSESGEDMAEATDPTTGAVVGEKRPAQAPADEGDLREFKMRKKTWSAGLGEIWDPDAVPIKLKSKREPPLEDKSSAFGSAAPSITTASTPPNGSALPKWTTKGWSKPGERHEATMSDSATKQETDGSDGAVATSSVTQEDSTPAVQVEGPELRVSSPHAELPLKAEETVVKMEDAVVANPSPVPSGGSMFKKRKAPAGSAGTRGKRAI